MRLWRLTRAPFMALDGSGPLEHGGRYSSPGKPVVNFASEAGLAVLIVLRYLPRDLAGIETGYLLGWTETDARPERVPDGNDEAVVQAFVEEWLDSRRSLLAVVASKVLPEADVVMMNPAHPDASRLPPLSARAFDFAECLHRPPMLGKLED